MSDTRVEIMTTRCDGCAVGAQPCVVIDGGAYGDVKLCKRHWALVMDVTIWRAHREAIANALEAGVARNLTAELV